MLTNLLDPFVVLQERLKLELLEEDDAHEEEAEDAVAKVAEHVVEVPDKAQRFPGQKKQYIELIYRDSVKGKVHLQRSL